MTGREVLRAVCVGLALGIPVPGCVAPAKPTVELAPKPQPQARAQVRQQPEQRPELKIASLLPPGGAVTGWSMDGEMREFPGRDIFNFIDGEAEVHLTYDFVTVATADYINDRKQYITVSVYQLSTPADAYGLNSYYSPLQGRPVDVGNDGKLRIGACRFWKGHYYVAVEANPVPELNAAAEAFGQWVAQRIPDRGAPPAMVALLPETGRKTEPPIFLHKPLILSGLTFQAVLVDPASLKLDERTDMVAAEYEGGFALSITRYPDEASARQAAEVYGPFLDRGAMLAEEMGPYLVASTSASDAARATFEEALNRLKSYAGR
jgi:hypothetical protein